MKYKHTLTEIITDDDLLKGKSLSQLKELTGHDKAYLSRVRSGKLIVSEEKYLDLKAYLGY